MKNYCRAVIGALFACTALFGTALTAGAADAEQGLYEIACAVDSGFVLDTRYCTVNEADTHELQMYRSLDVNQQKFYLEELPGVSPIYRISVLHSGDALTADEDSEDATALSVPVCTDTLQRTGGRAVEKSQTWILEDAGDGSYYIRSRLGKYLTLDASSPYNGASVVLRNFTGKLTQKWILEKTWISPVDNADTDLINPYAEDGAYSRMQLSVRFDDQVETLTAAELAEQISETEDHQLTIGDALTKWAQELADQYDTQGYPRIFRSTGGSEFTLYKGTYGYKLNVDKTAAAMSEAIQTNGSVEVEPVWSSKGQSFNRGDDIGDSYVEIDLTNQKVWLYKDGEQLLESDCVTGTYGTDRQTPGGVYSIYYKQSPDVLEGEGYSSWVQYWMPFNGGIGLHDANWRSSFGGNIYRSNGSHGCINLPTWAAATIYEVTYIGYPVVCYN